MEFIDEKTYIDDKLKKELEEKFGNMYGIVQPIIIELLLRRKYVFGLDDARCLEDAQRVIDNCKAIDFSYESNHAMGVASAYYNSIQVASTDQKDNELIIKILSHEFGHVLQFWFEGESKENSISNCNVSPENKSKFLDSMCLNSGLSYTRVHGKMPHHDFGVGFDEIFNEAATSLTFGFDRESPFYSKLELGYQTPAQLLPHSLSAALGVTDKEILKASLDGGLAFERYITSKFPVSSYDELMEKINVLQTKVEFLINADYDEGKFMASYEYLNIGNSIIDLALFQISNDDRELTSQYVLELSTRFNKINSVLEHASPTLYKYTMGSNAGENLSKNKQLCVDKVLGIYLYTKYQDRFDKDLSRVARNDTEHFLSILTNEYGIDINLERQNFPQEIKELREKNQDGYLERLKSEDTSNATFDNQKLYDIVDKIREQNKSFNVNKTIINPFIFDTFFVELKLNMNLKRDFNLSPKEEEKEFLTSNFGMYSKDLFEKTVKLQNELSIALEYSNMKAYNAEGISTSEFAKKEKSITFIKYKELQCATYDFLVSTLLQNDNEPLSSIDRAKEEKKINAILKTIANNEFYNKKTERKIIESGIPEKIQNEAKQKYDSNLAKKKLIDTLTYKKILLDVGSEKLSKFADEIKSAIDNGTFEETFSRIQSEIKVGKPLKTYIHEINSISNKMALRLNIENQIQDHVPILRPVLTTIKKIESKRRKAKMQTEKIQPVQNQIQVETQNKSQQAKISLKMIEHSCKEYEEEQEI